jgi:hypothetical protein
MTINQDVQIKLHAQPTIMLLTCKDKIVYINLRFNQMKNCRTNKKLCFLFSHDQNRPSNSDLFLLLLNNTSRSLREQFKFQQNNSTNKMAHTYKTMTDENNQTTTNSARNSTQDVHNLQDRLVKNLRCFVLIIF